MGALLRIKFVTLAALFCALGFGFAGCGVKGPLEPPPDAKVTGEAKSPEAQIRMRRRSRMKGSFSIRCCASFLASSRNFNAVATIALDG
jgi:predicted small lipoprotein YifL